MKNGDTPKRFLKKVSTFETLQKRGFFKKKVKINTVSRTNTDTE